VWPDDAAQMVRLDRHILLLRQFREFSFSGRRKTNCELFHVIRIRRRYVLFAKSTADDSSMGQFRMNVTRAVVGLTL